MRMFTFEKLSAEEFDAFALPHPQGNFQQTSKMGRMREGEGKTVIYAGIKEEGKVVAAGLLQIIHNGASTFAIIHDGPLMDYDDKELVAFFTQSIREAAREGGAAQIDITPEAVYRLHKQTGEPVSDPDDDMVGNLKEWGWDHVGGFSVGYTTVPRWRWVKDLTPFKGEDDLLASYEKDRRKNVRVARESGVVTRRLEKGELNVFHDMCLLSNERQGFKGRDLSYYEAMFDAFGPDGIEFRVAELHCDAYVAACKARLAELDAKKNVIEHNIETSRTDSRTEQLKKQLTTVEKQREPFLKRLEDSKGLIAERGEVIPLCAMMFLKHPREVTCTTSGADESMRKFYAPALVHHEMMVRCIEAGIPRYNRYGVNGIFTRENNPGYGVLEFKQHYNGFIEELPGEFVLPVRPGVYTMKKIAHKILGR